MWLRAAVPVTSLVRLLLAESGSGAYLSFPPRLREKSETVSTRGSRMRWLWRDRHFHGIL